MPHVWAPSCYWWTLWCSNCGILDDWLIFTCVIGYVISKTVINIVNQIDLCHCGANWNLLKSKRILKCNLQALLKCCKINIACICILGILFQWFIKTWIVQQGLSQSYIKAHLGIHIFKVYRTFNCDIAVFMHQGGTAERLKGLKLSLEETSLMG